MFIYQCQDKEKTEEEKRELAGGNVEEVEGTFRMIQPGSVYIVQ